MQIPAEISFHNIPSSPEIENEIRQRIGKLEKIFDRLTTCRVRVDQRNSNENGTIPPVVRIELSLPGHKDLVVSHEPEHLQRKFKHPDIHNAVHEAFHTAERQLAEFKAQLTNHKAEGTHEAANEFSGQIAEVTPGEDFGFLLTKEGGLLYFHRNSLLSGDFNALKRGMSVSYIEEMGDTGPTASKVRMRA